MEKVKRVTYKVSTSSGLYQLTDEHEPKRAIIESGPAWLAQFDWVTHKRLGDQSQYRLTELKSGLAVPGCWHTREGATHEGFAILAKSGEQEIRKQMKTVTQKHKGRVFPDRHKPALKLVASTFGVSVEELLSDIRTEKVATARQAFMYALRKQGYPYREIANTLNRSNSTITEGVRSLKDQYDTDQRIAEKVDHILQQLTKEPQ